MCDKVGIQTAASPRYSVRAAFRLPLLIVGALLLVGLAGSSRAAPSSDKPAGLRCLERYYGVRSENQDGHWLVHLGKSSLPYDDGLNKHAAQRIETPDLQDLFGERYLQHVTVQAGNSGLVVGTPSDPRMYGVTLRATY